MTKDEAMKLALEALVDFKWHNENCPQFSTWAEPKKHPLCTCEYDTAITALRKALDHVPDTMKMLEPDMGIDRGAWDDVPYATKWVDELRGGDEPWDTTDMAHRTGGLSMEQEPVAWMTNSEQDTTAEYMFCHVQTPMHDIPLYTAPPKREWQGLTDEEALALVDCLDPLLNKLFIIRAIEAKLKEKNT